MAEYMKYIKSLRRGESSNMSNNKKKENIGTIEGLELLKKTRGFQKGRFKTGWFKTQKDRPRDKNWKKWGGDDF